MTPLQRGYLLALSAPAVALTSSLLGLGTGSPGDPVLMAVLLILGAVATTYPVMVSPRYKADVSPAIHIAMVLLFQPAIAVALISASGLPGEGVPGAAIAAAVMYVVSTGLVVIAAGLHNKRSPVEIWAEAASADLKQT